jgi:hypothetical protein
VQAIEQSSAERAFRSDLDRQTFQIGTDRGYWQLAELTWPTAVFVVRAAPRPGGPDAFALRLELSGYPATPPAGLLWDLAADNALPPASWPTGGRAALAFNPHWRPDAIYLPTDRIGLDGHDPWRQQHPQHVWDPARDIVQYLRLVHEILNDDNYTGVLGG